MRWHDISGDNDSHDFGERYFTSELKSWLNASRLAAVWEHRKHWRRHVTNKLLPLNYRFGKTSPQKSLFRTESHHNFFIGYKFSDRLVLKVVLTDSEMICSFCFG